MIRGDAVRVFVASLIAAVLVKTGVTRLPVKPEIAGTPLTHPPVIVYSDLMLAPLVVSAERIMRREKSTPFHTLRHREVKVSLTQYCLQGLTRRDHYVRDGIVAADPRIFPLARYVEVFLGKHYLGRYLVDDTGGKVKGRTLDIWNPSCAQARRFGRQWGTAMLVVK